ncbi:MAG: helix-turn-helix domain-containing protein [Chloroflexi bacterium]|nr:helix-turn-helix domain-containing protein [Chloroflexota bacterium]
MEAFVRGRKKSIVLTLTADQRAELEAIGRSGLVEVRLWRRARAVLLWAEGATVPQIEAQVGLGETMLREWVKRFRARGLAGLNDLPGRGRKPVFPPGSRRIHGQARLRTA